MCLRPTGGPSHPRQRSFSRDPASPLPSPRQGQHAGDWDGQAIFLADLRLQTALEAERARNGVFAAKLVAVGIAVDVDADGDADRRQTYQRRSGASRTGSMSFLSSHPAEHAESVPLSLQQRLALKTARHSLTQEKARRTC